MQSRFAAAGQHAGQQQWHVQWHLQWELERTLSHRAQFVYSPCARRACVRSGSVLVGAFGAAAAGVLGTMLSFMSPCVPCVCLFGHVQWPAGQPGQQVRAGISCPTWTRGCAPPSRGSRVGRCSRLLCARRYGRRHAHRSGVRHTPNTLSSGERALSPLSNLRAETSLKYCGAGGPARAQDG